MAMATRRKKKFYAANPTCIFCGGHKPIESIEHCPPRALFQDGAWPDGFEFPACLSCNTGSSDQDLLVSMLARTGRFGLPQAEDDGKLQGLLYRVHKRFPDLISRMIRSPAEARKDNRRLGLIPSAGETHQQQTLKVTNELHEAVKVFAGKLSKGIFYKESGSIFPRDGTLLLNWFTNEQLLAQQDYPVFEIMNELGGTVPSMQRGNRYLDDQFQYRLNISADHRFFAIEARFSSAFGLLVFGSKTAGHLEAMVENLKATTGRDSPFSIIQSTM